jgi:hypothetical protein
VPITNPSTRELDGLFLWLGNCRLQKQGREETRQPFPMPRLGGEERLAVVSIHGVWSGSGF